MRQKNLRKVTTLGATLGNSWRHFLTLTWSNFSKLILILVAFDFSSYGINFQFATLDLKFLSFLNARNKLLDRIFYCFFNLYVPLLIVSNLCITTLHHAKTFSTTKLDLAWPQQTKLWALIFMKSPSLSKQIVKLRAPYFYWIRAINTLTLPLPFFKYVLQLIKRFRLVLKSRNLTFLEEIVLSIECFALFDSATSNLRPNHELTSISTLGIYISMVSSREDRDGHHCVHSLHGSAQAWPGRFDHCSTR